MSFSSDESTSTDGAVYDFIFMLGPGRFWERANDDHCDEMWEGDYDSFAEYSDANSTHLDDDKEPEGHIYMAFTQPIFDDSDSDSDPDFNNDAQEQTVEVAMPSQSLTQPEPRIDVVTILSPSDWVLVDEPGSPFHNMRGRVSSEYSPDRQGCQTSFTCNLSFGFVSGRIPLSPQLLAVSLSLCAFVAILLLPSGTNSGCLDLIFKVQPTPSVIMLVSSRMLAFLSQSYTSVITQLITMSFEKQLQRRLWLLGKKMEKQIWQIYLPRY